MRIALIADIHGNSTALDAVLADIERRGGVDAYWILGDLCAIGFDPIGVVERLRALPDALFVRGNADRYVTSGSLPAPTIEQVRADLDLLPVFAEVTGHFNFVAGCLSGRGLLGWLDALPTEQRVTLPDGTRVLLTHSTPTSDDDQGLNPALTDEEFRAETAACDADLICVGHFHLPMDRRLDGVRAVSPGPVSNNFAPDLRACYAILEAGANHHTIKHYRVAYDIEAVKAILRASHDPGAPYQMRFLEGDVRASWMRRWDGLAHAVTPAE
jgi:putative phosphoesterase